MSQDSLQQAYSLIKDGRKQEAIDVLEPVIEQDRNNSDAWWLLANATDDTDSKRQALQEVLRIGGNPSREDKAREMLNKLDEMDFDDLDPVPSASAQQSRPQKMSSSQGEFQQAPPQRQQPQQKEKSGASPLMIILAIVGGLAVFGCAACFGASAFFGNFVGDFATGFFEEGFNWITAPAEYDDMGAISVGDTREGRISSSDDYDGYTFDAESGQRVEFVVRSESDIVAPVLFIYSPNGDLFEGSNTGVESAGDFQGSATSTTTVTFAQDAEYLVVVRSIFGFGQTGYTLEVNDR